MMLAVLLQSSAVAGSGAHRVHCEGLLAQFRRVSTNRGAR